ncbi:MAG: exodeoxyribonuclease VII large subunit [Acidimicrobiales bacterium]
MGAHTHSVAELTARISDALTEAFDGDVWVQGEVHNLKVSPAGHAYFTLAEPGTLGTRSEASMPVVLFRGNRRAVEHVLAKAGGMALADDLQVRIRGEVTYYAPQGRVQLRMTAIDPSHTLGRLAADREALLRSLRAEGLLDRNRQLPMPPVPLRIGLVTSDGSAAAHDVVEELAASGIGWQVHLVDTRVQGADAVTQLVAALATCARADLDVVAVVRGGGSRIDLAAFDHEAVARAIASMPVPVLTGIGHEIDESIADRVAHRSFKTPTAVAAHLCDTVGTYRARCDELWATVARRATTVLDRQDERVVAAASRATSGARRSLEASAARVVELHASIRREPERALDRAERTLDSVARHVNALDPARVLARGWSITRTAEGDLVRSASQVSAGTPLTTRLADGEITSTVTDPPPGATPDA